MLYHEENLHLCLSQVLFFCFDDLKIVFAKHGDFTYKFY